MTSGQTGILSDPNDGVHRGTTVASLVVGAAFLALWFWLLPSWLGFEVDTVGAARWRWIAAVPSVLGFAVAVRCIWDFGRTGHGTPAPMAPPQRLVVVWPYRQLLALKQFFPGRETTVLLLDDRTGLDTGDA